MNKWLSVGVSILTALSIVGGPSAPAASAESHAAEEVGSWYMAAANPQRTSWTPEEIRGQMYPLWAVSIEAFIPHGNQMIAAYDTIYVSTAKGLYALNAETGALRWVFPTEMPLGNSPTVVDGVAYVGGYDHRLYALNAYTGEQLWSYEAGSGFATNPLVVEGKVILGNRDGYLYAINTNGTLAWKFQTNGPILFSAAYKDGVVYFASNDSYAYAVYTNGTQKWKSAKLPGGGFYSYWPVIYTKDGHDYAVLGGSYDYRQGGELWVGSLNNKLDRDALYGSAYGPEIPEGELVGPTGTEPGDWASGTITIDDSRAVQYLEEKPSRRRVFVLDANNGQEYTFDSDGDGKPEYAPITWYGAHGGSRYPAVVGGDGVLYAENSYISNPYIPRGGPAGWKFGTQYISRVHEGQYGAVDEPLSFSAGGKLIYWGWGNGAEGMAGYDITMPYGNPNRLWLYDNHGDSSWLTTACPGAGRPPATIRIYGSGAESPPVPYKGKIFFLALNTVFALSPQNGSCSVSSLPVTSTSTARVATTRQQIQEGLNAEIQKMVNAGHLRPGYHHGTLGTFHFGAMENSYMTDYSHNPAETFVTLIDALPYLSPSLAQQTRTYLQNEWSAYGNQTHIGWRDGAAREGFTIPPEIQARMNEFAPISSIWGTSWDYRFSLYGRWRYLKEFGSLSMAQQVYSQIRNSIAIKPPEQDTTWTETTVYNPYIKNAYIAGYIGYVGIGRMAGIAEADLAPYATELNRLLAERASEFSTDQPPIARSTRVIGIARNFMYLTPELADYLRTNALGKVQEALSEYYRVGPYWFVSKFDMTTGEGALQALYDYPALFQAKARIMKEPFEELVKYIDVPAFERGDLFYIQNLVLTLEASSTAPSPTFVDVPLSHPYHDVIEALYQAGYTAGCNTDPLMYCPEATMNRAESAVFVERGIHGTSGVPPQPTTQTFADLPLDSWAAKWAEALWQDGYTAGCGTDPLLYCPWQGHSRAEGCVFYLHMLNGPTYEPPQPSQQTFADVPLETWYAKWVQAAYDAELLEPCLTSPELRFCPNDPLSRALAAYMMVQAKGLQ